VPGGRAGLDGLAPASRGTPAIAPVPVAGAARPGAVPGRGPGTAPFLLVLLARRRRTTPPPGAVPGGGVRGPAGLACDCSDRSLLWRTRSSSSGERRTPPPGGLPG